MSLTSDRKVLILAEHDNQTLKKNTLSAITAALKLSSSLHIVIAGWQCESVAEEAAKLPGVEKVFCYTAPVLQHGLAENIAPLLVELAKNYFALVTAASTYGKNIFPRVAAGLGVGQISEVLDIVSEDTFRRPIYAGNAIATVHSRDPIKILTIRATAFNPVAIPENASSSANIEKIAYHIDQQLSEFLRNESQQKLRPELNEARIVISGGRGLQSKENFKILEEIADKLGAAIGATRAAVDAGFVPNDYQVGQTGKVVAPELYIAVGISGAIQHLAGMKDSKVIVAINKDKDAPIFQIADYSLVGDLFEILPEFSKELSQLNTKT